MVNSVHWYGYAHRREDGLFLGMVLEFELKVNEKEAKRHGRSRLRKKSLRLV